MHFSPYIPLDSAAYHTGNCLRLRRALGAYGFGLYVMVLSHLRASEAGSERMDFDALAFALHEDADALRRVVTEFDLFRLDPAAGTFSSPCVDRALERLSDTGRRPRGERRRRRSAEDKEAEKAEGNTEDNDRETTEGSAGEKAEEKAEGKAGNNAGEKAGKKAGEKRESKGKGGGKTKGSGRRAAASPTPPCEEEKKRKSPHPDNPLPPGSGSAPAGDAREAEGTGGAKDEIPAETSAADPGTTAGGEAPQVATAAQESGTSAAASADRLPHLPSAPDKRYDPGRRPPKAAEVLAFAALNDAPGFDAARFVCYYAGRGWKSGRERIRDWRFAVCGWLLRDRAAADTAAPSVAPPAGVSVRRDTASAAPSAFAAAAVPTPAELRRESLALRLARLTGLTGLATDTPAATAALAASSSTAASPAAYLEMPTVRTADASPCFTPKISISHDTASSSPAGLRADAPLADFPRSDGRSALAERRACTRALIDSHAVCAAF